MRPFEPADVVRNYRQKGMRPMWVGFGVSFFKENISCRDGQCCALSSFFVGEPIDVALDGDDDKYSIIAAARRRWPGFSPWSFIIGFDGLKPHNQGHVMTGLDNERFDDDAYRLGKECAELVRKELKA